MFGFADPWETATAYPVPAAAQASFCLCTEATGAETSRDAAPPRLVGFFFFPRSMWLLALTLGKTFSWPVKSDD